MTAEEEQALALAAQTRGDMMRQPMPAPIQGPAPGLGLQGLPDLSKVPTPVALSNQAAMSTDMSQVQSAPPTPPPATVMPVLAKPAQAAEQQPAGSQPAGPAGPKPPKLVAEISGGGYAPAREVDVMGKTGKAAVAKSIEASNEYADVAADTSIDRQLAQQEVAAASDAHVKSLAEHDARVEKELADRLAAQDKFNREADSEQRQLSNMKVDPERYWNNKSDLQKASYVIGSIFSGALEGYTKGAVKDRSWDKLQAEIERDTAAQERAYKMAKDSVEAKRSSFGQLVQRWGSIDAARNQSLAIKARQLDAVASSAAAKIGTADAKDKAAMVRMQAEQYAAGRTADTVTYKMASYTPQSITYRDELTGVRLENKTAQDIARDFHKERNEAATKGRPDAKAIDTDTRFIAQKLIERNVPDLRSAIAGYGKAEAEYKPTPGEGVGRAIAGRYLPPTAAALAAEKLYGKGATATDQAWSGFVNQAIKIDAGSGVTGNELVRKEQELLATRSPEARATAIANYAARAKSIEDVALAGVNPEAAKAFKQRTAAGQPAPPPPTREAKK